MNPKGNAKPTLNQWLERLGKPPLKNVESASERIWTALLSDADEIREGAHFTPPPDAEPVKFRSLRLPMLAVAATVVLLAVVSPVLVRSIVLRAGGVRAVVIEGALSRVAGEKANPLQTGQQIGPGELIRSIGDKGAVIALADGSRVEMRSESELLLERAEDGVRIRLNKGGVIVNAARQRRGHLYVQTNDVTVSVVGTVFLVNAEEEGSRVAVIEGEVRVQHGAAERKLRPGEQVATGPSMEPQPVKEEISWSRNAAAHVALLQETVNAPTTPKAGSVTGVVRTTDGGAASGIRVTAMRSDASDTALRALASLTETDVAGHYRLENVPAGDYYITVGRVDSPIFYPGTFEISKGNVVSITSSATVTDIDFLIEDINLVLPPSRDSRKSANAPATSLQTLRNTTLSKTNTVRTTRTESGSALRPRASQGNAAWWTDQTVIERLGVTEDQRKRAAAITDRYEQDFVQNQTAAEKETAKSKMEAEILAILTEAQRLQLQTEAPQPAAGNTTRNGTRLSRSSATGAPAPSAGATVSADDK
jgi:hypothetical protein